MKSILLCVMALLFVGSFTSSSEFSTKVKTDIIKVGLEHEAVLVVFDGEFDSLLDKLNPLQGILNPEILINQPQVVTDTYLYRSQAWIRGNNLHKTGILKTFISPNINKASKLC